MRPSETEQSGPSDSTDQSGWFRRAKAGDTKAVGQLLALYRPLLLKIAHKSIDANLRPKVAPSDLVQKTMLNASRQFKAHKFETRTKFLSWLREILRNETLNAYRTFCSTKKRNVFRERPLSSAEAKDCFAKLATSLSDSGQIHRSASDQLVRAALTRLPQHYELVLRMRYMEGHSLTAIASVLARSYDDARMLHNRALKRLQREIVLMRDGGMSSAD